MKAVLVINEMPHECYECPCYNDEYGLCLAEGIKVLGFGQKSRMCPLRPLPCKKYMRQMPSDVLEKGKRERDFIIHKVDVDNSYVEGWNDCLDEITGAENVLHK